MDYSLIQMIINLFSAENFLNSFYRARERILTQARDGKKAFFLFQYPVLGWVQYENHSIEKIYKLSQIKKPIELLEIHLNENYSKSQRIHSIAAYLLQKENEIMRLFNTSKNARDNSKVAKNGSFYFRCPFFELLNEGITLTYEELIKLQNNGHKKGFTPFIPLEKMESIFIREKDSMETYTDITM